MTNCHLLWCNKECLDEPPLGTWRLSSPSPYYLLVLPSQARTSYDMRNDARASTSRTPLDLHHIPQHSTSSTLSPRLRFHHQLLLIAECKQYTMKPAVLYLAVQMVLHCLARRPLPTTLE